jgi:hypothetical protein
MEAKILDETKLFNLLKNNLIPDLKQTDQFNAADATSNKYNLSIELKCRNEHYTTLLIEKKKYDKLILNSKCRYIVSTSLGIFSFNLKKIKEPVWYEQWLPNTYHFDKPELTLKEVGYLHINQAKNITNHLIN